MNKGFTIIEMLVALVIFSVLIAIVSDVFLSGFLASRRTLAFEEVFDQSSFLMEYLSRSLRMARKDLTGSCILAGTNYQLTRSGQGVKFLNSQSVCQEFYLDTGRLKEDKGGVWQYLTGATVEVTSLSFSLLGPGQEDEVQPRATFSISLRKRGARAVSQPFLQIQTTVAQRRLDIRY